MCPSIGAATIDNMHAAGASCIAIDAGKCLLIDGEQVTADRRSLQHRYASQMSQRAPNWISRRVSLGNATSWPFAIQREYSERDNA